MLLLLCNVVVESLKLLLKIVAVLFLILLFF